MPTQAEVDAVYAAVTLEIEDAAAEQSFEFGGAAAELAYEAFIAGANFGIQLAARIVQNGR